MSVPYEIPIKNAFRRATWKAEHSLYENAERGVSSIMQGKGGRSISERGISSIVQERTEFYRSSKNSFSALVILLEWRSLNY